MAARLFRVARLFNIAPDRLIVSTNCRTTDLPQALHVGDRIEFRGADGSSFRTQILGIPLGGNQDPNRTFEFLLPHDVTEEDIRGKLEVWTID